MSSLPALVHRAPKILYIAAVLFFLGSMTLTLCEVSVTMGSGNDLHGNPMVRVAVLRGLYQALLDALHIAATGVLAHILIAVWSSGSGAVARGDAE